MARTIDIAGDIAGQMREPTAIAKAALTAAALSAAVILAAAFMLRYAEGERERELRLWQSRLAMVAETRAVAVDAWLARQFGEVGRLAENASLQLYMAELVRKGDGRDRVTRDLAESGYLENLLTVVAERGGFTGRPTGPDVPANVRRLGVAGIALTDITGRKVAASKGAPSIDGRLRSFLGQARPGERALLDLHAGASGAPTMAFAAPVFAVQDEGAVRQIGWVIGVKEVAGELFARLRQPGTVWKSAEALLVRRRGNTVEYLSPRRDGATALSRALAVDTPGLAAAGAVAGIGGVAALRDYREAEVLVTARPIGGAPWTLLYKIDRDEALGARDSQITALILEALLVALLCAVAFVAVWRHGASRRATLSAARFEDLAVRHERQGRLLERVTDGQPYPIFILDTDNRLRFANSAMAKRARMARDDLIGKPLANVIGTASARPYEHGARRALDDRRVVTTALREGAGEGLRVAHVEQVPVEDFDDARSAVLVIEHDITDAVRERERRERTLGQLVRTLLTVVDRRDRHAADHSAQVSAVARAIAEEMSLDDATAEAAAVAGSVMNLGKILVPSDVLTRAGELDADELDQVREGMRASADLLQDVEFDGPVVEALRQIEERWDGTGPRGLRGDDILMPARIVAVANAFVAMVSPRSWRAGASFDGAVAQLTAGAGAAYDRRVVAALVNRLENRGGREAWRDMANEPVTV